MRAFLFFRHRPSILFYILLGLLYFNMAFLKNDSSPENSIREIISSLEENNVKKFNSYVDINLILLSSFRESFFTNQEEGENKDFDYSRFLEFNSKFKMVDKDYTFLETLFPPYVYIIRENVKDKIENGSLINYSYQIKNVLFPWMPDLLKKARIEYGDDPDMALAVIKNPENLEMVLGFLRYHKKWIITYIGNNKAITLKRLGELKSVFIPYQDIKELSLNSSKFPGIAHQVPELKHYAEDLQRAVHDKNIPLLDQYIDFAVLSCAPRNGHPSEGGSANPAPSDAPASVGHESGSSFPAPFSAPSKNLEREEFWAPQIPRYQLCQTQEKVSDTEKLERAQALLDTLQRSDVRVFSEEGSLILQSLTTDVSYKNFPNSLVGILPILDTLQLYKYRNVVPVTTFHAQYWALTRTEKKLRWVGYGTEDYFYDFGSQEFEPGARYENFLGEHTPNRHYSMPEFLTSFASHYYAWLQAEARNIQTLKNEAPDSIWKLITSTVRIMEKGEVDAALQNFHLDALGIFTLMNFPQIDTVEQALQFAHTCFDARQFSLSVIQRYILEGKVFSIFPPSSDLITKESMKLSYFDNPYLVSCHLSTSAQKNCYVTCIYQDGAWKIADFDTKPPKTDISFPSDFAAIRLPGHMNDPEYAVFRKLYEALLQRDGKKFTEVLGIALVDSFYVDSIETVVKECLRIENQLIEQGYITITPSHFTFQGKTHTISPGGWTFATIGKKDALRWIRYNGLSFIASIDVPDTIISVTDQDPRRFTPLYIRDRKQYDRHRQAFAQAEQSMAWAARFLDGISCENQEYRLRQTEKKLSLDGSLEIRSPLLRDATVEEMELLFTDSDGKLLETGTWKVHQALTPGMRTRLTFRIALNERQAYGVRQAAEGKLGMVVRVNALRLGDLDIRREAVELPVEMREDGTIGLKGYSDLPAVPFARPSVSRPAPSPHVKSYEQKATEEAAAQRVRADQLTPDFLARIRMEVSPTNPHPQRSLNVRILNGLPYGVQRGSIRVSLLDRSRPKDPVVVQSASFSINRSVPGGEELRLRFDQPEASELAEKAFRNKTWVLVATIENLLTRAVDIRDGRMELVGGMVSPWVTNGTDTVLVYKPAALPRPKARPLAPSGKKAGTALLAALESERDMVGGAFAPDSRPDAHLRVALDSGPSPLTAVRADALEGGLERWTSAPDQAGAALLIVRNEAPLNPGGQAFSLPLDTPAELDLYLQDSGLLREGKKTLRLTFVFADGRRRYALLPPSPAPRS